MLAEDVACPICLTELYINREEVGALTFDGKRVEQELYHVGCVTQMLIHTGSFGPSKTVQWGLSPVSRLQVNGFKRVPALSETEEWLAFLAWRGSEIIGSKELAATIIASLPQLPFGTAMHDVVDGVLSFVSSHVEKHGGDDVISMSKLRDGILPQLLHEETLTRLWCSPSGSSSKATVRALERETDVNEDVLRYLGDLGSLRACCRDWRVATGILFVQAICHALPTRAEKIAIAATRALGKLERRGNTQALVHITRWTKHKLPAMRSAAVSCLEQIASKEDPMPIQALIQCLHDIDGHVRGCAAQALTQLTTDPDSIVVSALSSCLADNPLGSRRVIIKAILKLAKKGNQKAIAAVSAQIYSSDLATRLTALASLPHIADRGDAKLVETLTSTLSDGDDHMRWSSLAGLSQVADWGDENVIAVVCAQLHKGPSFVHQEALRTLAQLAPGSNREAVHAVASCADSDDATTRWVCLQALGEIALRGDRTACSAAEKLLMDEDVLVGLEAARVHAMLSATDEAFSWRCNGNTPKKDSHSLAAQNAASSSCACIALQPCEPLPCVEHVAVQPKDELPGSRWRDRKFAHLTVVERPVVTLLPEAPRSWSISAPRLLLL